jgi:predicted small secreted protein
VRCLTDKFSSFASSIWTPLLLRCGVLAAALAQIVLLLVFNNIRLDWRFIMRRLIFASLMLVLLVTSAACNTVHGFGRDVERVGEETQDAANSVRRRL